MGSKMKVFMFQGLFRVRAKMWTLISSSLHQVHLTVATRNYVVASVFPFIYSRQTPRRLFFYQSGLLTTESVSDTETSDKTVAENQTCTGEVEALKEQDNLGVTSKKVTRSKKTKSGNSADGEEMPQEVDRKVLAKKAAKPVVESVQYAVDHEELVDKKFTSLLRFQQFPLFHPSRSEFFVMPPIVPDIYIPGFTERGSAENPHFPSVSVILQETMSSQSIRTLQRWKDRMIKEVGQEQFEVLQEETLTRGRDFHSVIEGYLKDKDTSPEIEAGSSIEALWESARHVVKRLGEVHAVEQSVYHKDLCYHGKFDCIAEYKGSRMLLEWKTSKRAKVELKYMYDKPMQVAAYLGAYNSCADRAFMVDKAMFVVCYEDGQPAHTLYMSRSTCIEYWQQWLNKLHQYWSRQIKCGNTG